jgi:hypothetical protein
LALFFVWLWEGGGEWGLFCLNRPQSMQSHRAACVLCPGINRRQCFSLNFLSLSPQFDYLTHHSH